MEEEGEAVEEEEEEEGKMARHKLTDEDDGADDGVGDDMETDDGDQHRESKHGGFLW